MSYMRGMIRKLAKPLRPPEYTPDGGGANSKTARQARWRSLAVFERRCEGLCSGYPTPSHEPQFELDNFELRPKDAAQQPVFHNSLAQKPLMDCIALATHTHIAPGTVHRHWAENCHFEKVSVAEPAVRRKLCPILGLRPWTAGCHRPPIPKSLLEDRQSTPTRLAGGLRCEQSSPEFTAIVRFLAGC